MTMKDPLTLSAKEILKIDKINPEKIFSVDIYQLQFRRMRSHWHPDKSSDPQAEEVFKLLMDMGEIAEERIASNTWKTKANLLYKTADGKTLRFFYRAFRSFELGKMYIGDTKVVYVLDDEYGQYYKNGIRAINDIKYKDAKLKKVFEPSMPKVVRQDKTDIGYVVVVEKPKGMILLQDLIDYLPNKTLPPKHTAWVVSRLYNVAAFLELNGICHNSILPTTVFVNPEEHAIAVLGGWWYSTKAESKLKAVPAELIKVLPKEVFKEKKSKTSYDRLAIKGVGIGCLGDSTLIGSRLLMDKDIPKPFLTWLRSPSSANAIKEYEGWDKTLEISFGKKKFIKLDVNINDVYK